MPTHSVVTTVEDLEAFLHEVIVPPSRKGKAEERQKARPLPPWLTTLQDLMVALESAAVLSRARGLSREIGYAAGLEAAEGLLSASEDGVERLELFLTLPYLVCTFGAGVSELVFQDERYEMEWTFPHGTTLGAAALRERGRKGPGCSFLEGVGTGWVEGTLGLEMHLAETDCVAAGDARCRFRPRPLPGWDPLWARPRGPPPRSGTII